MGNVECFVDLLYEVSHAERPIMQQTVLNVNCITSQGPSGRGPSRARVGRGGVGWGRGEGVCGGGARKSFH